MAKNNQRGSSNNNKESRSQYTGAAVVDYARERPATAAVAAAAAVGAGVFLWSRRNQISEQLSGLSDQIGQWSEKMNRGQQDQQLETAGASSTTTTTGMSETGGGNASLGRQTGGTGTAGTL